MGIHLIRLALGSANVLDLGGMPGMDSGVLHAHDPTRVKEAIALSAATDAVFPYLKTGVRFWPFLLVARDLDGKGWRAIGAHLKRIRAAQPLGRRNRGPGTPASFNAYRSMHQEVAQGRDTALKNFLLDRRRTYDGRFEIFARHERAWQKALVATMGSPAAEFAKLLVAQKKRTVDAEEAIALSDVERSISDALAAHTTSGRLWHACACYAFLRCMYGVREASTKVVPAFKSEQWAAQLASAIRSGKRPEARLFERYAGPIDRAHERPPWGHLHRSLQRADRQIFSDLRFHTFANLYLRPSPRGYGRDR
jgi:hypothetical protein